ncbi:unnamed protein product, partial [Linum tenue]
SIQTLKPQAHSLSSSLSGGSAELFQHSLRLQSMAENLIVLSDEDADYPSTPISSRPKRLRATRAELGLDPAPTIFLMDDDPSPLKPTPSSSYAATVVPETPMSDVAAAGRCTVGLSAPEIRVPDFGSKTCGNGGVTRLEPKRFESVGCSGIGNWWESETAVWRARFSASVYSL